jgi:hypothetical protein
MLNGAGDIGVREFAIIDGATETAGAVEGVPVAAAGVGFE